MARYDVKPGSTSRGVTVGTNDIMSVSSTGIAIDTTLNGTYTSAFLYLNEGGIASNTYIQNGRMYISNGGHAKGTTLYNGYEVIYAGGHEDGAIVSGGTLELAYGASATNINVLSGGAMLGDYNATNYITGTSRGKTIKLGNGQMLNLTVYTNREMLVSEGWIASNTTLNGNYASAQMFVKAGGKASNTLISSGRMYVSNGGYTENTTLIGGSQIIYTGSHEHGAIIKGGIFDLAYGASATNIQIVSNGFMTADYNHKSYITGTSQGKTIKAGDGEMLNLTVYTNRSMLVSQGWVASNTTLNGTYASACMYTLDGGTATNTIVSSGRMYVSNGGYTENTTLLNGSQVISAGGWEHRGIVKGGVLYLLYGASATDIQVVNDGVMIGDFDDTSYITGTSQGKIISAGDGEMLNLTVYTNREMVVSEGWIASNTTLNGNYASALMYTLSGGVASNTIINNGRMFVSSGAYTQSTSLVNGSQIILAGGHEHGVVVKGGTLYLSNGASATDIQIINNGAMIANFGSTSYITGTSQGKSIKAGDGEMLNLTIYTDRSMVVGKGWKASNTILNGTYASAQMFVEKEAQAYGTIISSGRMYISAGGYAENTYQAAGSQIIYNGGTASGGSVKGGTMYVANGGTVKGTELRTEGTIILSAGAKAYDLVLSNSNLGMSAGAQLIRTSVCRGGKLAVSNSNVANDTQVLAGGTATIFSKAAASGGNVMSGGTLIFSSGAILTGTLNAAGTITVKNGATVSNGTLNFNLVDLKAGNRVILNDMSLLTGANYSITVSGSQAEGSYKLATGAGAFNGTITVKNESGNTLGSLSIGGTLNAGGNSYTLTRNNAALSLTVTASGPSKSPAGDIDGNGVSDVMFQYKVDHQIGFWMNGSNTWKGQGLPEPVEWEVVGAYDMNANGKADVVMLGNVTVNGVKGAYVGYRKDGDMSTWENISYLNNPDNIQWNVKVGNMTGNAGKNSIVWHAAELGAVGVWTDGTDSWVSISGGFDKNWTMLGTGDFNGDGKDEILFRNGTNFYTTDINSNFSSLGGFGDGWDARAIGDFSGDGKDDLVLFHKDTGSVVKLENGQTSSYASLGQLDANDWFIVGAGDYNGDGKDDLLVRQYSSGMLGYYANGDFSKWNEMGRGVDMNWAVIA